MVWLSPPHSPAALVETLKKDALAASSRCQYISRDDYLEFASLTRKFIDIGTPITFVRPGAMHRARWLAKLFYMIKICLFEKSISDLPPGTITSRYQPAKIRRFVNFVTLVYSIWWMKCTCAADAPWNDLCFFYNILAYKSIVEPVTVSA